MGYTNIGLHMLYAKRGELVTCTAGHRVLEVREDMVLAPLVTSGVTVPRPAGVCRCGAAFARWTAEVHIELHFEVGGWRNLNGPSFRARSVPSGQRHDENDGMDTQVDSEKRPRRRFG